MANNSRKTAKKKNESNGRDTPKKDDWPTIDFNWEPIEWEPLKDWPFIE